jgi:CHASE1-domain containing sensor protein
MSIEGILALVVLALVTLAWVGLPLVRANQQMRGMSAESAQVAISAERQRERLMIYYQRVLRNLHDLDEDHATGKLNDDEYTLEREAWVQRGVAALKALDDLANTPLVVESPEMNPDDARLDSAIDEAIEAAVRKARQQTAN